MEMFYLILLLFLAFAVLYTKQVRKRGCGRGCARCGNRDFCHRRSLNMGKAAEKTDSTAGT